ncbi:MAG: cytochrome c biogenesis protein CcsA [Fimbriimonadaceae bacterium]|nr:cytochrome c biogenesis protein CcsA [Fimbriimonadaceae bacterium]
MTSDRPAADWLLAALLGCALVALLAGLFNRRAWLRPALVSGTLLAATAMGLLWRGLLQHDFAIDYVVRHSSRDLPTAYRVAALWAGQEGTVLLWTFLLFVVAAAIWDPQRPGARGATVVLAAVLTGFGALLLVRSPYALVSGSLPDDGHGLNPLLRNPWMIIHPPVLFAGYALLTVPFAWAVSAFARREPDGWLDVARPWLLAGWVLLGAGMMLGGYWAYITLGWGGFWAWDPVENSSLIPWLFATALLHGCLLQRRCGAFRMANYVLALLSFATVIYGSYLTRSGVLGDFSVHSFESLGTQVNSVWLGLVLMPVGAALGLLWTVRRSSQRPGVPANLERLAQATWLLILMALLVLGGTSAPLVTKLLGEPSAVQQGFYNQTQSACLGLAGLLLVLLLPPRGKRQVVLVSVAAALAAGLAGGLLGALPALRDRIGLLLVAASCGAMAATAGTRLRRGWLGRRWPEAGAGLAHLGMALLAVGAIYSGAGQRVDTVQLTEGRAAALEQIGGEARFVESATLPDGKLALTLAHGERQGTALVYETSMGVMRHPTIFHRLTGDLYLEPDQVEEGGGGLEAVLTKGESKVVGGLRLQFVSFEMGTHGSGAGDMSVGAKLRAEWPGHSVHVTPRFVVKGEGEFESPPETVNGHALRVTQIMPGHGATKGQVRVTVTPPGQPEGLQLVLKVTWKPGIALVWVGTVLALLGGALALGGRWNAERTQGTGTKGNAR